MKNPPNIIMLVLDCVRADRLSCYGYDRIKTENIDRVASEGTLFRNAYAGGCWTMPSHASMFTGLHLPEHTVSEENLRLPDRIGTLAEGLAGKGYRTMCLTQNPWISEDTGLARGFADYRGHTDIRVDSVPLLSPLLRTLKGRKVLGKNLSEILYSLIAGKLYRKNDSEMLLGLLGKVIGKQTKQTAESKPFFMFVNLMDTHLPRNPPKRFQQELSIGPGEYESAKQLNEDLRASMARFYADKQLFSPEQWDTIEKLYDASVLFLDYFVGSLVEILKKHGIYDDTVLVITSDHGEHLGEHSFIEHHFSLHEELVKVPLIIRAPGMDLSGDGGEKDDIFETRKLFHILLDYAEGTNSDSITGKGGAFGEMKRQVMTMRRYRDKVPEFPADDYDYTARYLRDGNHKYIRYEGPGFPDGIKEELFDVEKDPEEENNIAGEEQEVLESMRTRLDEKVSGMQVVSDNAPVETISVELREKLKGLGYID